MPELISIPVGPLEANCYLIYCPLTKETIVVDPGDEGQKIIQIIQDNQFKPILIVNTHGHVDHIGANAALKAEYDIPLAIHADDACMLTDPQANLSAAIAMDTTSPAADQLLKDGDTIQLGSTPLTVIHTPGHSQGGICLHYDHTLISGDTLFQGSIGRADLPGSDFAALMQSIQERLETLDDETAVYPGHGPKTSIGEEKRTNPFLLRPSGRPCQDS